MKKSKVLLVYPPPQLMETEMPRPDGSLGLPYLAGALERVGVEADILDASVGTKEHRLEQTFYRQVLQENGLVKIGLSQEEIMEIIARGGYSIVCISSIFTPQTKMALMVAQAAKAVSREILVVAGGVNARSLADRFLNAGVDVICATEGEAVIVNIVRAFEEGRKLTEITGTITMQNGKIVKRPVSMSDVCMDLDQLPFPAWDKLPLQHYDLVLGGGRGVLKDEKRSLAMMTSRGCPFNCAYCHISFEKKYSEESGGIGKYRLKSLERVVAELETLKALGVGKVYMEDDSLLAKKPRVREIFNQVKHMGLELADVNGVNLVHFLKGSGKGGKQVIDREFLELLCEAGLRDIVFPVEAASQRVLDKYATGKLNHEKLDVVELVRIATEVGIRCPINMMVGFPDETEEEVYASFELGKRMVDAGAPYCSLYIPIPFPGSMLFEYSLKHGHLDPDFNTDDFNWRKPVMKNTTIHPDRLVQLQEWGWKKYVNKPEFVAKRLAMSVTAGPRWNPGVAS